MHHKKGRQPIKPTSLTSFWHRRICEAIVAFSLLITGLFAWAMMTKIAVSSEFYISPVTAGLSLVAGVMAIFSYFLISEKYRTTTAYVAYWMLVLAVTSLNATTGAVGSPFIATWMVVAIFAGIFGPFSLIILALTINTYFVSLLLGSQITNSLLISIILTGELPLLVSYILWHSKSSSDASKEQTIHKMSSELNQVSDKADAVISAISDGVIAVDRRGVIELINPAAQRIIGWVRQDAMGLDYHSVLQLVDGNGKELDKATDPVQNTLATSQPVRRNDLQLLTSSGKKLYVEVIVSTLGRGGSGAIIVFRDVTKEQAEERAQAEFISTASHEMRTPVASIEGYLGLALNPATATIDEKARSYITKAHEAARHLGQLFHDLLDVSKAEDGRLSNNPKVIDVSSFAENIMDALKTKAEEKQLRLFFNPANNIGSSRVVEPAYFAVVDADHLREVLSNLIENAIKYTPAGQVKLDIKGDDSHVVISVTDSGIGIPAEDIPHLFQKFYRVDNSDTREIGGTGLGLYLCRRLVEAMQGRIWVESEYKKGSTFFVELPRISHEEATRLIEASTAEAIQPSHESAPLADSNGSIAQTQATPASVPVMLTHTKTPGVTTTPAPSGTEPTSDVIHDPLVGIAPHPQATETLHPHNPMVLPPKMQAIQSNLQTAAKPVTPQPNLVPPHPQTLGPTLPPRPTPSPQQPASRPVATPVVSTTHEPAPLSASATSAPTQPAAPRPVATPTVPDPRPIDVPTRIEKP